jgi:hypothetical protein
VERHEGWCGLISGTGVRLASQRGAERDMGLFAGLMVAGAPTSMKVSDLRLVVDWRRYASASSAMHSRNSSVALEISFTACRPENPRHARDIQHKPVPLRTAADMRVAHVDLWDDLHHGRFYTE